jgi:hypothetical protein
MNEAEMNQQLEPISDALTSTLASFNYEYEELIDEQVDLNAKSQQNNSNLLQSSTSAILDLFAVSTTSTPISPSTAVNKTLVETAMSGTNVDQDVAEFRSLMETRRNESNEFRVVLVCAGMAIVSVGLLANLLFGLLVACPNKRRPRRTPTQLIMLGMCLAYMFALVMYCLRVSVYVSDAEAETIAKFHMYDTLERWLYGAVMCRAVSGAPVLVKLVARFSILLVIVRRLVRKVYYSEANAQRRMDDFSNSGSSRGVVVVVGGEGECDKLHIEEDGDLNILRGRSKSRRKYELNGGRKGAAGGFNRRASGGVVSTGKGCCRLEWAAKLCRTPLVLVLVAVVWTGSAVGSLPIFLSYKLDEHGICDSVHLFPEDTAKVALLHFNYMLYGLVLPLGKI